ncbi:MAG: hypothetical protein QM764_04165 [Chitinophagaceae bacterium]
MKKIASILFLLILVFNFWGYRWTLAYMEKKSTVRLEQKIDAGNYDESQLVEVKIPLNLPYYTDWNEYRSDYGEAQLNGENYQCVKRKVVGDTLYLLCLPHVEKNTLQLAKSDYFKSVNNIQHDGQQKGNQPASVKLMLSEFLPNDEIAYRCDIHPSILSPFSKDICLLSQFDPLTAAQPPEC